MKVMMPILVVLALVGCGREAWPGITAAVKRDLDPLFAMLGAPGAVDVDRIRRYCDEALLADALAGQHDGLGFLSVEFVQVDSQLTIIEAERLDGDKGSMTVSDGTHRLRVPVVERRGTWLLDRGTVTSEPDPGR